MGAASERTPLSLCSISPRRGWVRVGSKVGSCQDEQGPAPSDSRCKDREGQRGTDPRNGGRRHQNRTGANPRTGFQVPYAVLLNNVRHFTSGTLSTRRCTWNRTTAFWSRTRPSTGASTSTTTFAKVSPNQSPRSATGGVVNKWFLNFSYFTPTVILGEGIVFWRSGAETQCVAGYVSMLRRCGEMTDLSGRSC